MQARRCIRDFRADTGILMVGKDSRNGVFGAFELRAAPLVCHEDSSSYRNVSSFFVHTDKHAVFCFM